MPRLKRGGKGRDGGANPFQRPTVPLELLVGPGGSVGATVPRHCSLCLWAC
jgi:hypothetical protein